VSGYGDQRELLKILEGTDIQIPLDFGFSSRGPRALISTRDICFFAVGAFSGIRSLFEKGGLGFLQKVEENLDGEAIAYKLTEEEADDVSRFHLFGFLPELIARYNRIVPFAPLDNDTLKEIFFLKVEKYIREFQEEGFRLHLEPMVADFIITEAIRRQTGARGLDVLISKHLEEVAFEIFGKGDEGEVILRVASDKVSHTIKRRA